MRMYLSQCDKKYTEDDIDCLTLDLLDKYISVENKKFKLNIYDKKGKLNKNGEVVLNVLHEKFPHVTRNRIKFHLEDHVKKSLSNFAFFDDLESEKYDFIFTMRDAVAYTLNQEKYFSPELYEEIKITHGVIDGTFFTLHYFQCIFYGLMMYYQDEDPQIRKSIIINSFDIIEIFEKSPEEFAKSKFAKINNISNSEEVLDFFIKSIYSESIAKKDCDEIRTIIKQLYSTTYSKEAKKSVCDQFHVTQTNLLFPYGKKLFIDKDGKVDVGFPTIYELVMKKKLNLPPKLISSYQNLPDEVKLYEYELTITDISAQEL